MKNTCKYGIIVLVAVIIGYLMLACKDSSIPLETDENLTGLSFTLTDNDSAYSVSKAKTTETDVIIPAFYAGKPVTSIGIAGFYEAEELKSIQMPSSVKIARLAFAGCAALRDVKIPSGPYIWEFTFADCSSLRNVAFPDDLLGIGYSAFSQCALMDITLPSGTISIGDSAFWGCVNLKSVVLPESITKIGDFAFDQCDELTHVTLLGGAIKSANFGDSAFYGNLKEIFFSADGGTGTYSRTFGSTFWIKE